MRYTYIILLPLFFSIFLSCEMKKEIFGQEEVPDIEDTTNTGLLDLELKPEKEADIPVSKGGNASGSQTVILDVNEFAIDIIDENGNTVKHYDSYADLKNEGGLLLPAGNYSIRATLGEDVNAGFDKPFYSGTNVCEITPQEVAKVITDCVLSNKKVTFHCSDDFLKKFNNDYSIVVDNRVGALTTQNGEKRTTYLKNTGILQFTVYATMKNGGKTLVYNYDMSKNEEIQQYNNILIDLDLEEGDNSPDEPDDNEPVEPDDPVVPDDSASVKNPVIKVDISLIEKEYVIEIPSDFIDAGGEDDGGNDDGGGGDAVAKPAISGDGFLISQPYTIKLDEADKAKVAILIKAPGKLASLGVSMSSSNGKLEEALAAIKLDASFDLCNLTEQQKEKLGDPLIGITPVQKGITSTTFDISNFMGMISSTMGEGDYYFSVTVKDQAGQQSSAKLTIRMKK